MSEVFLVVDGEPALCFPLLGGTTPAAVVDARIYTGTRRDTVELVIEQNGARRTLALVHQAQCPYCGGTIFVETVDGGCYCISSTDCQRETCWGGLNQPLPSSLVRDEEGCPYDFKLARLILMAWVNEVSPPKVVCPNRFAHTQPTTSW